jgi:hypothetical protein
VFYDAGRHVLHGVRLYPRAHGSALRAGTAFVYPPQTAWAFAALALLPFALAHVLFTIGSAAALAAGVWLFARDRPLLAVPVLLSASSLRGIDVGSINAAMFLLLAVAWNRRGSGALSGLAVASLVVAKLFLAPLLCWLALARRASAFVGSAVVALTALASVALWDFDPWSYARMLGALASREAARSSSTVGLLVRAGLSLPAAQAIALAVAVCVVATAGAAYLWGRFDERVLFGSGVVGAFLACPIVWNHYQVLLFAPVLTLPKHRVKVACLVALLDGGIPGTTLSQLTPLAILALVASATWLCSAPTRREDSPAQGIVAGTAAAAPAVPRSTTHPSVRPPRALGHVASGPVLVHRGSTGDAAAGALLGSLAADYVVKHD